MSSTIGFLLPRSDMYPAIGLNFLNGFKLGLNKSNTRLEDLELIVESIGNAADDKHIKLAEKIILEKNADLIISFGSSHRLSELTSVFNAYKKPLIHVDLGGNILKKKALSPYVLFHTLNLWQSAYASGKHAAETLGKKAAVAASFYDGGYHLTQGFISGFTDHGGTLDYFYVAPMDYKEESFESMIKGLEECKPDVVFMLFSFNEAKKIFDTLSQSSLNGKLHFMTTPIMTDELVNTHNYKLEQVYSMASWAFDDTNEEMKSFLTNYRSNYNETPNVMSLLGYETGLTLATCLEETGGIPSEIGEFMKSKTLQSPRGEVNFNAFNESLTSNFKLRKFQFNQVKYHNTVVGTLETSFVDDLYEKFESLPDSSWKNPYICT